ncbi:MAG: hypothetical protein OXD01_03155 [Gammaproteobacteria bacterium]|nr:hypothetical protein [Gammaproteobacteria bacterium]
MNGAIDISRPRIKPLIAGVLPVSSLQDAPELWQMVEDRLKVGWSPEQISGRFRQEGFEVAVPVWIYRCVHA